MTDAVSQYQPKTNTNSNTSISSQKHNSLIWIMLVAFIFLICISLWLLLGLITRVSLDNQQALGQYQINAVPVNAYLWQSGYLRQVNQVKLVYTNDNIPIIYELMNQNEYVLKLYAQRVGKVVNVQVNYNPAKFVDVVASPDWLSTDLYAGICLAMYDNPNTVTIDECYQQANSFIQWAVDNNIGKAVTPRSAHSWSLVGQVHAQTCSGTIPCGNNARTCTCPNSGNPCNPGDNCGGIFTCQCTPWFCQTSGSPNNMNCSNINHPLTCGGANLSNCLQQCTVVRTDPPVNPMCTWSGPPPPVPTYTPGPTPTAGPPPATGGCGASCDPGICSEGTCSHPAHICYCGGPAHHSCTLPQFAPGYSEHSFWTEPNIIFLVGARNNNMPGGEVRLRAYRDALAGGGSTDTV